jgi:hypothetical protein
MASSLATGVHGNLFALLYFTHRKTARTLIVCFFILYFWFRGAPAPL